jgi:hypothetical protein
MAMTSAKLEKQGRAAAKKAKGAATKMRSEAVPVAKRVAGQAWEGVKGGLEAIDGSARQARDVSVKASKSVVAYTKKKPIRALAIAAASGALLHAAVNVFRPSRDKQTGARKTVKQ